MADLSIEWLRGLAEKGGKGVVNNIDARSLGRVADELEEWRQAASVEAGLRREFLAQRDALVKALEGIAGFCSGDASKLGAIDRLVSIRNTALNVLAHVGSSGKP